LPVGYDVYGISLLTELCVVGGGVNITVYGNKYVTTESEQITTSCENRLRYANNSPVHGIQRMNVRIQFHLFGINSVFCTSHFVKNTAV
jgi:hypothetical protein